MITDCTMVADCARILQLKAVLADAIKALTDTVRAQAEETAQLKSELDAARQRIIQPGGDEVC